MTTPIATEAANATVTWNLPLNAPIRYTQGFMGTEYPYSPDGYHRALDMVREGDINANLFAVAAGYVLHNKSNSYLGNYLVIAHADDYFSLYAHLQTRAFPAEGSSVLAAQRIGNVGGTPNFDPHLHLELFKGRYFRGDYEGAHPPGGTRIDPQPILRGAPYPDQVSSTPPPTLEEEDDDDMPAVIYRGGDHPPVLAIGSKFWAVSEAEWNSAVAGGVPSVWLEKITLQNLISDARASKTKGAAPLILRQPGATTYIAHGGAVILRSDEEIRNLKNALDVPEMTVSQQRADIIVADLRNGGNS
ncbi:MAG: family metallopeptidase [Microbacterium sp.]|nr:family metallopeptidase [Microbacterium sp.]